MPSLLDALILELKLQKDDFNRGVSDVSDNLDKFKKRLETGFNDVERQTKKTTDSINYLNRGFSGLLALLGGSLGVAAMKGFVEQLATADSAIGRLSANLATSPQNISAWAQAVERMGGNAGAAAGSFQALYDKVWKLTNLGENMSPAFWMGLGKGGGTDQFFKTKDSFERMMVIARTIQNIGAQYGRDQAAAYGRNAFGLDESSVNLILEKGPKLREYLEDIKRKTTPSEADIKAAQRLQESWVSLTQTAVDFGRKVQTALTPHLEKILKGVEKWIEKLDKNAIAKSIETIAAKFAGVDGERITKFFERFAFVTEAILNALFNTLIRINSLVDIVSGASWEELRKNYPELYGGGAAPSGLGISGGAGVGVGVGGGGGGNAGSGRSSSGGGYQGGGDSAGDGSGARSSDGKNGSSSGSSSGGGSAGGEQPGWFGRQWNSIKEFFGYGGSSGNAAPQQGQGNGQTTQQGSGAFPDAASVEKGYTAGQQATDAQLMAIAMDQLRKEGVTGDLRAKAAAMVGLTTLESGDVHDPRALHNPNAIHDHGTGHGIYGAGKERRNAMWAWLDANGYKRNDALGQMRYMIHEALTSKRFAYTRQQLQGGDYPSLLENIYGIRKNFEAPANAHDQDARAAVRRAYEAAGIKPPPSNTAAAIGAEAVTAVGGVPPRAFIMHHTSGRGGVEGVIATLRQRRLGVQYVMDREGNIYKIGGPGASHILPGTGVGTGLNNRNVVGMEVIARDDKDVTPEQVAAAQAFIRRMYPNTPVYGHGEVNPGHKEADEGMKIVNAIRAERTVKAKETPPVAAPQGEWSAFWKRFFSGGGNPSNRGTTDFQTAHTDQPKPSEHAGRDLHRHLHDLSKKRALGGAALTHAHNTQSNNSRTTNTSQNIDTVHVDLSNVKDAHEFAKALGPELKKLMPDHKPTQAAA